MKCLLFAGDHPRHRAFHKTLIDRFDVTGIVRMKREDHMPPVPAGTCSHDAKNFLLHFMRRAEIENRYFGMYGEEVFDRVRAHVCTPETLNGNDTIKFVKSCGADVAVVFGTLLLKDGLLQALPPLRINMHLGLSPWYRGAATLFWPFYNMEPNQAGVTIHEIVPDADAGTIYHQVVPDLAADDGIHDVACKAVVQGMEGMTQILRKVGRGDKLTAVPQKSAVGRLYLSTSFRPAHLRVNYDLFGDRMAGAYIRRDFDVRPTRLIVQEGL